MRGEAFWGLKNPKQTQEFRGLCPLEPRWGVAPGPHQGPLMSRLLDPTPCTLRSTVWSETIFIQPPCSNKSRTCPYARNEGMNSLKIHMGPMHKRYMIVKSY